MKTLDRRGFIKSAGKGAVGLMTAGPLVRSGFAKDSPNERIKVAVMGIRSRGRAHANSLAKLPNVEVAVL